MSGRRSAAAYLPALLLVATLGGSSWLLIHQGHTPLQLLQASQQWLLTYPWLLLLAFALRPLILFPVSLMVMATGAILGLPWALAIAWAGHTLSAVTAYALVRWLSPRPPSSADAGRLQAWRQQVREQGFHAVLFMRITLVPFDLANFSCAWLRVPIRPYLIATAIGIIPSNLAMANFGASLDLHRLLHGQAQLPWQQLVNTQQLFFSVAIVLISILIAKRLERRRSAATSPAADAEA